MKRTIITMAICLAVAVFSACSDDNADSGKTNQGTHNDDVSHNNSEDGTSIEEEEEDTTGKVDKNGKCIDKSVKEEPGKCGCKFEDKDIDDDGEIDCPVRVIPQNVLPALEDIEGSCAEWKYPKHPKIEFPDLPEYGYEVTIDTEKYGISKVYDITKAKETTEGFNKALKEYKEAGYSRIVIPPGHYPVISSGIKPPNHTALIMSHKVFIQMIPTDAYDCGIIDLNSKQHIYIEGGTLIGDKYEHKDVLYDECNHIRAVRGGHFFINGVTFKDSHGDSVMIVDKTEDGEVKNSQNIIIANSDISGNHCGGIGVCGADGVRITNNYIHNIEGCGDPEFGIDFESQYPNQNKNFNAIVDHNRFENNKGGDIIIDLHDVFIEYNTFSQGNRDRYDDNPFIPRGYSSYIFYRNKVEKFTNSTGCGMQLFCTYHEPKHDNPSFMVENDLPATRVQLTRHPKVCVKDNVLHEGHLSASGIKQLRLYNNRVEKFTDSAAEGKLAFSFHNVRGKSSGNVVCKKEDGNEVCTENTDINKMTENEDFSYNMHLY